VDELRRLNSTFDSTDEPFAAAPKRRERKRRIRPSRPMSSFDWWLDVALTITLTVGQLVLGGALTVGAVLEGFTYDACGGPDPECNYALVPFAFYVVPVACVLAFALTICGIRALYRRSRAAWWIPLASTGISLAGFAVSMLLTVIATGRPIS
jgi:hypothetical protein